MTDTTQRLIDAISGNDYIEKNLIPQCVNWTELRHLLELDGLTSFDGIYIYSMDIDTKQINDSLFGYSK